MARSNNSAAAVCAQCVINADLGLTGARPFERRACPVKSPAESSVRWTHRLKVRVEMEAPEPAETMGKKRKPWYAEGLRFTCQRCGKCCSGPPGYVWVSEQERKRIAVYLAMELREFERRFCRQVLYKRSLKERPNGDCIFLAPEGCRIYPVRPRQCRSFPFWSSTLSRSSQWNSLKLRCSGVGTGRLYSLEEIEDILRGRCDT